jgi:hypothetical protein
MDTRIRIATLVAALALSAASQAGTVASCDELDAEMKGVHVELGDSDIKLVDDGLVLRADGNELIRIDAARNLTVSGRPVAVPKDARADLDAYVTGFRKLTVDAGEIGAAGGRIAAKALGGLVSVMFSSETMDDYERRMEAQGAAIEARADSLCRTVAALQRTERSLQQRIPAFPNFIAPANIAL